ncbi:core trichothecene cluster (CTC) protein 14 [Colletotrichum spaethianum]|uniref:Core trichothecene cluster (CTC) protein 14 n=1 Tax=Colletotrichum spaethianum TaxID=700344 RepID=A0AA37UL23_9PEZI|nr:core trichothecene cluster (CTC) protein 14 [Colletotrichum spaethianum]GKT52109.1 core trichothecene cluster (CTC) protein 14 [Colletotrichum spaethianum]
MFFLLLLALCSGFSAAIACPPLKGDIQFDNVFQLYPAYFVWDSTRCLIYASSIFNATVAVLDPYKSELLEIIKFPGMSHSGLEKSDKRLPGISLDVASSVLTVIIQADEFFLTGGNDVSGDNFVIRYDLNKKSILSEVNLTDTTRGQYGGFLDIEPGLDDDIFVNGAYPASILRISNDNKVSPYFVSKPTTPPRTYGFGGLARYGHLLITNDNPHHQLVKFDLGTHNIATPVVIPQTTYHNFSAGTSLRLPQKYRGNVLLQTESNVAQNITGVSVWSTADSWQTAEYHGLIDGRNDFDGFAPAISQVDVREIMGRIYSSILFYDNTVNPTMAGNRSNFMLRDISSKVDALLK